MRKIVSFVCVISMVFILFIGSALAAGEYEQPVAPNAVMLLDTTTGNILFEKNADEQIRPASTTKILTCIIALENANMDDVVEVGPEGDWTGSGYSLLGTKDGEQIVMKDLLHGLMLVSGNDAAAAIAVHIGGSEQGFVDMMNKKALEIGMSGSAFLNPHGTDTDGHYVTARDMSKLALYAMQNEEFMRIVEKATYDMPATNMNEARTVENTNLLLHSDDEQGFFYEYATGIKTGATPKAFRCLVSTAKKEETQLLCLIYGDETQEGTQRWPLAKSLFEYGFANYTTLNVQTIIDNAGAQSVPVQNAGGDDQMLALSVRNTGESLITLDKSVADSIAAQDGLETVIALNSGDQVNAPVQQGDVLGTITFKSTATGETICQGELIAQSSVDEQGVLTLDESDDAPRVTNTKDESSKPAAGITWLWIVLAAVILVIIVALIVSLIRGGRRR